MFVFILLIFLSLLTAHFLSREENKKNLYTISIEIFYYAVHDTDGRGRTDTPEGTRF